MLFLFSLPQAPDTKQQCGNSQDANVSEEPAGDGYVCDALELAIRHMNQGPGCGGIHTRPLRWFGRSKAMWPTRPFFFSPPKWHRCFSLVSLEYIAQILWHPQTDEPPMRHDGAVVVHNGPRLKGGESSPAID